MTAAVWAVWTEDHPGDSVRSSVLGRFTPQLCDAVLGREDSGAVLAELERSNMFLVALDARGEWYRYHHLFRERLELELGLEDAVGYLAAAGDAETVAELLVESHRQFVWGGRLEHLLGWVRWLPPELLLEHPSLPASGRWPRRCSRGPRSRSGSCSQWPSGQYASARKSGRRTLMRS
jgi:ATP/maltotriose-dependent transcriptional regulator MalT